MGDDKQPDPKQQEEIPSVKKLDREAKKEATPGEKGPIEKGLERQGLDPENS